MNFGHVQVFVVSFLHTTIESCAPSRGVDCILYKVSDLCYGEIKPYPFSIPFFYTRTTIHADICLTVRNSAG